jgi:hypothetical protein
MDWKARLQEKIDRCARRAVAILESVDGKPPSDLKREIDEKAGMLEKAKNKKEAASITDDILELQKIAAARLMSDIIGELKDSRDARMLAGATYDLGYLMGFIERTLLICHPDLHKLIDSRLGSKYADQRWEGDRHWYRVAEEKAKEYYEGGGTLRHDELAKKYVDDYHLSPAALREIIKPIARRYGKVRGDKK